MTQLAQRVVKEAENNDVDLMLISEGVTYDEETMTFPGASNRLRFDFTLSTPFPADGEYEIGAFNREAETNAVKFGISIAPLTLNP